MTAQTPAIASLFQQQEGGRARRLYELHEGHVFIIIIIIITITIIFPLFRAAPMAYGGSQARG